MDQDEKSFRLKYVGARFDGARLPVDVLSDLPAFRDLLVAFAKDEWRVLHEERQRVPKGFDKSIAFDLVAIEPGSAVPKLSWNRRTAQANLPGFSDELELIVDASFVDVVDLIDGAGNDDLPLALSSEHVRALNKLGAGLRDQERIEFLGTAGRDGNVVYLDNYRRKTLITKVRETYQARFEGTGELIGSNAPRDSIGYLEVKTAEHGVIKIPLDSDRIKEDFDGNLHCDIQFDLQIELDNNDRYRSIVEVFDLVVIDAQLEADLDRCRKRLAELRGLPVGWHDGAGAAISEGAFAAADRLLAKRPTVASVYKIYPTEAGGILFEFERVGWDLSVEFGPEGAVEIYGVEIRGDGELEPQAFDSLSDEFLATFDRHVGR